MTDDVDPMAPAPVPELTEPDEDAAAMVVFTSGTTSLPKAAVLSHRSVMANLHQLLVRTGQLPGAEARPGGVHLCTLPLFHMSGIQTILLNLVAGGRLVFLDGRFDAGQVLQLIAGQSVTAWAAIPTMLVRVLEHPAVATTDTSSLRSVALGGAPVPAGLLAAAEAAFPSVRRRTGESYGSTEAGGTVATTTFDRESGTTGPRAFPTIDVVIDWPEADGRGEVLVRSAALMNGYLGVAAADQPIDEDGWLHTGDLGRIDEHGILHITGRAKDLIIRGGENISPTAVEDAVRDHPSVLDVVVIGISDSTWGEVVGAVVRFRDDRPAPTDDELRTHAASRVARYAVPTRWFRTGEPFPLTDTGKVRRDEVRSTWT
ncbi:MAG: long-chain fatty acid--CoA ligase [Acidimicrobiia bacterium]|nr:long-chain fatty acid--CoA ligase [Acidimicrobiia bacterium]